MTSYLIETCKRVKQKGFKACVRYAVEKFDPYLGYPVGRLEYLARVSRNQPYFGHFCAAGQGVAAGVHNLERKRVREARMRLLVAATCTPGAADCRILEVGSWAGWSAIVWGQALLDLKQKAGSVVCVDPWTNYRDLTVDRGSPAYRTMAAATRRDAIVRLFYHNIRASGQAGVVHPFRGSADCCLPMLRDGWFSLAFVDGDHTHAAVKRDLHNASRLVREGGLLCGDDLELQFGEVDDATLRAEAERDWTTDPKSQQGYHPGVALAVWEFFHKRVSSWDGLWAMRKVGSAWEPVDLPPV